MTYYMGWCFLVLCFFFFFPCFLGMGWGGESIVIVPGWAGEQLVSIRCQLGWRLCQGRGGRGDTAAAFVCVSEWRAAPGARGRGHREGGCHGVVGVVGTRPLPGRLGGRAGGAPSCSDLSHATHAEAGRVVGQGDGGAGGDEGGAQHRCCSRGGHILLCPAGISTQRSHGRSCTSASVGG